MKTKKSGINKKNSRGSSKTKHVKAIAFSEMFIMIMATFAFAFLMNAQMVGAIGGGGAATAAREAGLLQKIYTTGKFWLWDAPSTLVVGTKNIPGIYDVGKLVVVKGGGGVYEVAKGVVTTAWRAPGTVYYVGKGATEGAVDIVGLRPISATKDIYSGISKGTEVIMYGYKGAAAVEQAPEGTVSITPGKVGTAVPEGIVDIIDIPPITAADGDVFITPGKAGTAVPEGIVDIIDIPPIAPSFLRQAGAVTGGIIVGFVWSMAANYAVATIGHLIDKDGKYNLEISALASGVSFYVGAVAAQAAGAAILGHLGGGAVLMAPWTGVAGTVGTGLGAGTAVVTGAGAGGATATGATGIFANPFVYHPYILAAAIIYMAYVYFTSEEKEGKQETIYFKCMSWQAPVGGGDCKKCNEDALKPCSEYRCKALGQGCGIINAGTGQEKCIWMNPHDTASPKITPWKDVLTAGYEYASAGSNGMKIVKAGGGCISAFTAITFGIKTDEPGQCKIDYKHKKGFDEMSYYIDNNNLYAQNHSQAVSLPGTKLLNSLYPDMQNDGNYNLYLRCRDGNGNENEAEYAISFCVDRGPDATAPQIKATDPLNNAPVQYKVDNVTTLVYTNEPGSCRWSRADADYNSMENNMSCTNQVWQMNAQNLYTCITTLTGVADRQDNKFYFRCRDLSNNTMRQSYAYTLKGTQPLDILKVGPNETIGGATSTVTVKLHAETDNGENNGKSTCYFSSTGEDGSYIAFFETGGNVHNQNLDLPAGSYKYYFMCVDLGGNTDSDETEFRVVVDTSVPAVVRAYNENDKLKIATNEKAACKYSIQSCNFDFDAGLAMVPDEDKKNHYTEWKTGQAYYIKCSDDYGNMPAPSMCSIIVRPSSR